MIVYHYHPDTGVFLNASSEADEDPMQPGNFLIPAYATQFNPPSPPDPKKQHAVWNGFNWQIETIPVPSRTALHDNMKDYDPDPLMPHKLYKQLSIKEALKGGLG